VDLTREQPRPMEATLEGYVWLPRMIDKGRAKLAGTLGDVVHPCPVDHTCLTRLRVRPEEFLAVLAGSATDADVLAGLRALGIPPADEARFDPIAVEDDLQERGFGVKTLRSDELPFSNIAHELVGADHGASVTLVLVEAPPGAGPRMHSHPYEEILIVQEGEATFRLGLAERIVRAGEIVIVAPGQAHAFTNTGAGPLRQVDIHLSPRFETDWLDDPAS
jgi:quercetin dioxygenase-like cupin family protein